jgi:hypothetical protein
MKSTQLTTAQSKEMLARHGFSKRQVNLIRQKLKREQNEQEEGEKHEISFPVNSTVSLQRKKFIEQNLKEGWRPEHNPMINKVKQYNAWLEEQIRLWESNDNLMEYLGEVLANGEITPKAEERRKSLALDHRAITGYLSDDINLILAFIEEKEEEQEDWPEERFRWERSKYRRQKKNEAAGITPTPTKATKAKHAMFEEWWDYSHEVLFDKKNMTGLPIPPCGLCPMKICKENKKETMGICEHTLKLWYQAADQYQETLLLECRRWHPDRFHKCMDDVRDDLVNKATVFFQLLGTLLEGVEAEAREKEEWMTGKSY